MAGPADAKLDDNLRVSFDTVGDAHKSAGVMEHADQLKPEDIAVERDRAPEVGHSDDHFADPERSDRVHRDGR
jgi:hypothetical protein